MTVTISSKNYMLLCLLVELSSCTNDKDIIFAPLALAIISEFRLTTCRRSYLNKKLNNHHFLKEERYYLPWIRINHLDCLFQNESLSSGKDTRANSKIFFAVNSKSKWFMNIIKTFRYNPSIRVLGGHHVAKLSCTSQEDLKRIYIGLD